MPPPSRRWSRFCSPTMGRDYRLRLRCSPRGTTCRSFALRIPLRRRVGFGCSIVWVPLPNPGRRHCAFRPLLGGSRYLSVVSPGAAGVPPGKQPPAQVGQFQIRDVSLGELFTYTRCVKLLIHTSLSWILWEPFRNLFRGAFFAPKGPFLLSQG